MKGRVPNGFGGWSDPKGRKMDEETARRRLPRVTCEGCGWRGSVAELEYDPEEDERAPAGEQIMMWCPQCGGAWWVYD